MKYIITHIFTEYGQVEYQDLLGNRLNLLEKWDANRPLQELVQRVQKIQEFANNGGRMIVDKDIVDTIYTLVYNTGLFYNDCNKWDDKQRDEKTWANFQAHFQAAQRKYKIKKKESTRVGVYHGANKLIEMDGTHNALINLVTSSADDRETMMSQCKTITNLTATVAALTQKLHQANTVYNRGSGIPLDRQGKANPKWVKGKHVCAVGGY